MGPVNIEHNNGDDDGDDGHADDHDIYHDHVHNYWWSGLCCDYITINLNNGYGNNFELDYLQDVDISKGVDRGDDYDNDDNGDDHIDLEGPLGSYKEYIR